MNKNNKLDFTEAIQNGINDFARLWEGKNAIDNKQVGYLENCKKSKLISFKLLVKLLTFIKFK